MIDVIGLSLDDAKKILADHDIKFKIVETFSPKPLEDVDRAMVLRQKWFDEYCELVVGYFKTEL